MAPSIGVSGERQKFLRLLQQDGESISSWESRIRNQSAQCEYESFEDEFMRDQFIAGLISERLRVKLIGKGHRHKDGERAKVSLREVVEVAKAFETTTVTNQLMKTARETQEYEQVNYSNYSTRQKQISRDPCYWCNSKHKQPRQKFCPAYSKRCNKCGTLGHFARVCRSSEIYLPSQQQQQQQHANQLEVEDNYANEELFVVDSDQNKQGTKKMQKFFAHLTIVETNCSRVVRAQIDSASTCNTIPLGILYQLFPNIKIDKTKAAIQTYGNQKIKPLGKVILCCERKGKLHLLDFLVVDVPQGKPPLLSGRDAQFLGYLDIHADEIHSLDKVNNSEMMSSTKHQQNQNIPVKGKSPEFSKSPRLGKLTKEYVLGHYKDVFKAGKGKPLSAPMHIEMDPNIRPVHAPRRRIPVARVQRANEALEKLCEDEELQ